jgi:formate dehydrogenase subunit delta
MRPDDLLRMSTQIAQFFEPYPEADAIAGVQNHIQKFWQPSMRKELLAIHSAGNPPLHPLVVQAVDRMVAGTTG